MDLTYYDRYLPHRLPAGHSFFITFRLAGSLPAEVVLRLQEEKILLEEEAARRRRAGLPDDVYTRQKQWFARYDTCLDTSAKGPMYLREQALGEVVVQALHYYHEHSAYELLSYCIMPNHVHLVVLLPDEAPSLLRTLQGLKSYTARRLNAMRGTTGRVWQPESYDHRIRNPRELQNILRYTLHNPVKAGFVEDWQQWPFTFLSNE